MSNQREITEQLDALSIYHFLLNYTTLEEMIKSLYVEKWPDFNNEVQQRLMFYQGGLNMQKSFIEYDTYSVVTQHHKFDVEAMLNNLTLNQMIKVERKENQISELKFDIQSLQNRTIVYPCIDCILKLLNMRNILAHKMNDLNFKNKEYIDVLKNEIIQQRNGVLPVKRTMKNNKFSFRQPMISADGNFTLHRLQIHEISSVSLRATCVAGVDCYNNQYSLLSFELVLPDL